MDVIKDARMQQPRFTVHGNVLFGFCRVSCFTVLTVFIYCALTFYIIFLAFYISCHFKTVFVVFNHFIFIHFFMYFISIMCSSDAFNELRTLLIRIHLVFVVIA